MSFIFQGIDEMKEVGLTHNTRQIERQKNLLGALMGALK